MYLRRLIHISIAGLLSACGGGTTTSVIPSNSNTFLDSDSSLSYDSAVAEAARISSEFQNLNGSGANSPFSPLEAINAHKAYGYGLSGAGQVIAIMDSSFFNQHQELDSKTLTTFGTLGNATPSSYHGLAVASIAAGEADGAGIQGVAPAANLHLSDYTRYGGEIYLPDRWAALTSDAASHDAIAQNNSWGIDYMMSSLQADIQSDGDSNAEGVASRLNINHYTANAASVSAYIQALNNFQQKGVVVYAVSNTYSYTDADFQAALPELFPELAEAWLATIDIEPPNTNNNLKHTRESAPCGSTAAYCLGADGTNIKTASFQTGSTSAYEDNVYGTSFVAPQVSGALALLAEAFPNHSPEQLTDRLLASANNDFFTATAYTTFTNGVQHGYNSEFGHGFMDIYGALNPIVNTGSPRMVTGPRLSSSSSYTISNSQVTASSSFGDGLSRGLEKKLVYAYDDLNGGFAFPLSNSINNSSSSLNIGLHLGQQLDTWQANYASIKAQPANFSLTSSTSQLQIPYLNQTSHQHQQKYRTAYLPGSLFFSTGLGSSQSSQELKHSNFAFGWQTSALETWQVTATSGIDSQAEKLLGLTGRGAFSLENSLSNSTFASLELEHNITPTSHLTAFYTTAASSMSTPSDSIFHDANRIISDSFSLAASQQWGSDEISLQISQPHRVNSGSMTVKTADLADSSGNLNYSLSEISIEPSGRQLDVSLGYATWLNKNLRLSLSHKTSFEPGHVATASQQQQSFLGIGKDWFQAGIGHNKTTHQTQFLVRIQPPK